jgi:hypothetical protein
LKPKVNLDDPRAKALIAISATRASIAYSASERLADAVRPVQALSESGKRLEQIGSCVLVVIAGELFAFSAAHVLELVGNYQVPIAWGGALQMCAGERFSTAVGPSGTHADDRMDAAVLHIESPVPDGMREDALNVADFDLELDAEPDGWYVAVGYRAKAVSINDSTMTSHQDLYPSLGWLRETYFEHGLSPDAYTSIAFEKQVLVGDRWITSPQPRGMSGGAVLRIRDLPVDPTTPVYKAVSPKLRAIICERHVKTESLRGTNIRSHLALIERYIPGILARGGMLHSESADRLHAG